MISFIQKIKCDSRACYGKAASAEAIKDAETKLHLSFSDEYKEYLTALSLMAIDGREFTGLSKADRVNVVAVTEYQRKVNENLIPEDFYVIEEKNIDGIIIWQNSKGEIFETTPSRIVNKIAESMEQYIYG